MPVRSLAVGWGYRGIPQMLYMESVYWGGAGGCCSSEKTVQ